MGVVLYALKNLLVARHGYETNKYKGMNLKT